MKLTLFTNIPSPHQIPLSRRLAEKLPGNFSLVCWDPIDDERKNLQWSDEYNNDWIIKAWISEKLYKKAIELINSSDVVIWGYAPVSKINDRVKQGKLTFLNTERIFKKGRWRIFDPRVFLNLYKLTKFSNKVNYHLLAIGENCSNDFKLIHAFKNKIWRWGYFPELPEYHVEKHKKEVPTILWVGRMIGWKRVELLIRAVRFAYDKGCPTFNLRLIGFGQNEQLLKKLVRDLDLESICRFDEPMSSVEIGKAMDEAEIYVLASDQNEGWGVVVNEAMSRACCVIGSKSAGSVPWLIEDGKTGYILNDDSHETLGQLLIKCIKEEENRIIIGNAAKNYIYSKWSPEIAAERFINFSNNLLENKKSLYTDGGPCSFIE